ncbi:MAG: hypothetical protein Q8904_05300 [Bacteroidota bacterium]|nr:hypothetical protein [Bacteroidota bacterium]
MKKIVLFFFLFLVFQQQVLCQYSKGKFYIEANYNYVNNGKMVDNEGTKEITSTFSSNAGYFVLTNLVLGIGLNYHYWFNSQTDLGMTGSLNGVYFSKVYITNSDMIKGYSPSVFVKYIYPVTHRLGVSIMAKSFVGKLTELAYESDKDVIQDISHNYFAWSSAGNYKGLAFSPEIRYLIKEQVGLQLNFNGLNVVSMSMPANVSTNYTSMYQNSFLSPTETNKTTAINFAPKYWNLGIFLLL